MPKKKKKSKKKVKKTVTKKRVKKRKISKKKRKTVKKVRKTKKKIKLKPIIKLPNIRLKTAKINLFKKITFQGTVNWLLNPIFKAWDSYLERKRHLKIQRMEFERKEKIRQKKEAARLRLEFKKKELQGAKKIEIERRKDLKKVISEGRSLLRAEQAAEKRKIYEEMQVQRKLDQFARREKNEIANLEKIALRENINEYQEVQDRIDAIRKKYSEIREAKFRERYREMGIDVASTDSREDLYEKHRIFEEQRKKVEQVLESFYRSSQSLIFQLNRRWLPKNMEILRVIDRRWENNEFFIKLDNEIEDNWIMLCYLESDENTEKPIIIVEDKTSEKYITKKFSTSGIFEYSDWMVDRWTAFLDREFKKKKES